MASPFVTITVPRPILMSGSVALLVWLVTLPAIVRSGSMLTGDRNDRAALGVPGPSIVACWTALTTCALRNRSVHPGVGAPAAATLVKAPPRAP